MIKISKFWLRWFLQAVVAFLIAYGVLGPVFRITFSNASRTINVVELSVIILLILIPFWIIQLVAIPGMIRPSQTKTWLVWLGAYTLGVGPAIVGAHTLTQHMPSGRVARIALFSASTAILVFFFLFAVQIYDITVVDLAMRILLR